MFCDDCGDIVIAAKPLLVIYPSDESEKSILNLAERLQKEGYEVLEILVCIECWDKDFKGSRKRRVASIMRILRDE